MIAHLGRLLLSVAVPKEIGSSKVPLPVGWNIVRCCKGAKKTEFCTSSPRLPIGTCTTSAIKCGVRPRRQNAWRTEEA